MNFEDFLETPKIELLALNEHIVTFKSSRQFVAQNRVKFEIEGHPVKVKVEEVRTGTDAEKYYLGEILEGAEYLEAHFSSSEIPVHEQKRRIPRIPHRMRILSQRLPNFQALSLDFSPLGLKVQLEGPVEVGSVIPLLVDFDWPGQEPIQTWAKVSWVRAESGHHIAGLEFVDVGALTREFLQAFYSEMVSGDPGDVVKAVAHQRELAEAGSLSLKAPATKSLLAVSGHLEGYQVAGDRLQITLCDGASKTVWNFTDLGFLSDLRSLSGLEVSEAWELNESEEKRKASSSRPVPLLRTATPLRHIQLVNRNGLVVLELVAASSELL